MNRLLILIIGIFFVGPSYAQDGDIVRYEYCPDKVVMVKEIMEKLNFEDKDSSNQNLIYIKRIMYRHNGVIQVESFFKNGVCLREVKYDKKGRKHYEYLFEYENEKEVAPASKGLVNLYSKTYKTKWYAKGELFMTESRKNDKRDGVTEIYDNKGKVKRILIHENGKKISSEKAI